MLLLIKQGGRANCRTQRLTRSDGGNSDQSPLPQPTCRLLWPEHASIASQSCSRDRSNRCDQSCGAEYRQPRREPLSALVFRPIGAIMASAREAIGPRPGSRHGRKCRLSHRESALLERHLQHRTVRLTPRKRRRWSDAVRSFARVTLLVALLVTADAGSVFAQQGSHFQRVTTNASRGSRLPYSRGPRSSSARDRQAQRTASGLASASTTKAAEVAPLKAQSDVLHLYSSRSRALAQTDDRGSGAGQFSTWRDQPQPAAPAPRVQATPRSHNYYPTLRSGVYAAQRVQLTANQTFLLPQTCCSTSSSQSMAGAGSQSLSGMAGAHHH
jgi:hypothetical protein